ncbi:MAG: transcriptional regulator, partial [Acidimicrobiia bacterium]
AQRLGTVQANVSKTEKRQDLLLSTLAHYFAAMGADDVKIVVRRGDREIEVAFDALTSRC